MSLIFTLWIIEVRIRSGLSLVSLSLTFLLSQLVKKAITLSIFSQSSSSSETYCIINTLFLSFVFDLEVSLIVYLAQLFAYKETFAWLFAVEGDWAWLFTNLFDTCFGTLIFLWKRYYLQKIFAYLALVFFQRLAFR